MITKIDSKNIFDKNLDEQSLYKKYPQLLDILLIDRTTGNNIYGQQIITSRPSFICL